MPNLGKRINDLLQATGLAVDDDFSRYFNEGGNPEAGTSANAHHSYLREQFRGLADLAASVMTLCSGADVREYLSVAGDRQQFGRGCKLDPSS